MTFLWENLRMAFLSLRSNKLRSLLTTLGIVIGITTVIAILSVVEGLNLAFARELSSIGSNVLYIQKWRWASNDWNLTRKWKKIDFQELEAIRQGITHSDIATPLTRTIRTVRYKKRKIEDTLVTGVGDGYQELRNLSPAAGRFLSGTDIRHGRNLAVVGWEISDKLFAHEYPIGKKLKIGGKNLTIVGVLEKRGDFFDMNLDRTVIMPIAAFQKHFGSRRSLSIVVRPLDGDNPEKAIDELRSILRRVRKIPFGKPDNFAINQVDALRQLYKKLTGGLYGAMIGVASISLLVGGIGIMNIMLVSVTERTREIGIRKAVGAGRRAILVQFLIESILLACVGGVIGIVLGYGLAALINAVAPVPARVQWWTVLLGLGFSAAVGIVFGLYPAGRAAMKSPIACLRYE